MTLQLELTKEAEKILRETAQHNGIQPNEYATQLLERSLKSQNGVRLLEQWLNETSPEAIAEQVATYSDLEEQLNQNRPSPMRKLFPT